jgi:exopolysaccharide/PEP-CTERM locus tyrosine autokinase
MSVIERALEKARSNAEGGAAPTLQAPRGAAVAGVLSGVDTAATASHWKASAPRIVDAPQLEITDELLSQIGLRAPTEQLHQQSAEYRHIKRQILATMHVGSAGNSRLIMMASALAGEGKTYTAANLALSLTLEPDYTVLLVDADIIKPNLTRLFGLIDYPGIMDSAVDVKLDIESAIVSTSIPGLSILPAGRANDNATEYFASVHMAQVFEQLLATPNRIVVVDSLPLLLTTEARSLLPHAGQVLLVVRAESTPRNAVLQALNLMPEETNVKLLLNAIERSPLSEYYGYGHGYNYNYARSEQKPGEKGA